MRGPHARLFDEGMGDCLVEGPVGTGKSFAGLWWLRTQAETRPGTRWLLCRKTRVDLTQSTLVTFEKYVLGDDHAAIHGTASRANRKDYIFPNGSEIIVAGMNNPGSVLSSEYNGAFNDEFVEFTREDYELQAGRMRNHLNTGGPPGQIVNCTNPRGFWHWVNLAANDGLFERLRSRHCHNPALYADGDWTEAGISYFERIRKTYTGARFEQYVRGEWADDSGRVFPMYDPATHRLDATVHHDGGRVWLRRTLPDESTWEREIMWTAAGVDWGYSNPGAIQVWGWDKEGIGYLLAEVYRRGKDQDWWVERAIELKKEFNIRRFVCDSAEPGKIQVFNDRMGTPGGREENRIAIKAVKERDANLTHVQALLVPNNATPENRRGSRIYLLKDTLRHGVDEENLGTGKPTCLHDEFIQLMYLKRDAEQERPDREDIDPTQHKHAFDATSYVLRWAWKKNLAGAPPVNPIREGSWADVLGHRRKLQRRRRRDSDR